MVIIEGSLSFAEEHRDDVLGGLAEVTRLSRRDAGCVSYWWAEDLADRNTFRFFECWESADALEAHLAMPHEATFGERYLPLITGATASVYEAVPRDGAPAS